MRWVVSRGRVVRDATGEPVRILGTVLDVTDARQQSESRLVGAAARRRRSRRWPPSWPTPRASRTWPTSCCAGRRCWAPSPARWRSSTADGGPLRLHMTRRSRRRGAGPRRLPRRGHRDRARRRAADAVRRHARPPRAAAHPGGDAGPLPGHPGGQRGAGRARGRRPAAPGGGPGARVVRRDLGGRPRLLRGRRRAARGAGRPDRAERVPAAGRRRARRRGRGDGRGERAAAAARRRRSRALGLARHHPADRSARRARRPGAGRLVLARRHRRAGPAAATWRAPTATPAAGRSWSATSGRW